MKHPTPIDPRDHAVYSPDKMGKSTLFQSDRLLVGLNAFEPGQEHALHAHAGMDKVYHVIEGQGLFLLEGRAASMEAGTVLVAPEGVFIILMLYHSCTVTTPAAPTARSTTTPRE